MSTTVEQQGDLPRLEQEMREYVPADFCDTLTSILSLDNLRNEQVATIEEVTAEYSRERPLGSIAEGVVASGVVSRMDLVRLTELLTPSITGEQQSFDQSMVMGKFSAERTKIIGRITRTCRGRGITSLFPDHTAITSRLDDSLGEIRELISEDGFAQPAEIRDAFENAGVLRTLVGVEELLLVDEALAEESKTLPKEELLQKRKQLLAEAIEYMHGFRVESPEEYARKTLHTAGPVAGRFFEKIASLKRLDNTFIEYMASAESLLAKQTEKQLEAIEISEQAYQAMGEQILHIVQHVPQVLRENIKVAGEEGTERELLRTIGVLCVENWLEAAYKQLGVKDTRENTKPLHVAIEKVEREQQLAELAAVLEPLFAGVAEINEKYTISGRFLRERSEGLPLRRKLEDYQEPGSNRALFNKDQAHQIAGLALLAEDEAKAIQFSGDAGQLRELWAKIAFLSPRTRREGLISNLDALIEWHESASSRLLNDRQLAPVWALARMLEQPSQDMNEAAPAIEDEEDCGEGDHNILPWRIPSEFAHVEFIEAFPPGASSNIIVEDLTRISRDYDGDPVDWERIYSLIKLRQELESQGFLVETHRLMQTSWHVLPHYVLEVSAPRHSSAEPVAIVESPIYGNASYIIPSAEWRDIVRFSKQEARTLGAVAKVHAAHISSAEHRQKLQNAVIASL